MPILSDIDKSNLHKYKYTGGDSSPIYQYILSPIAQFCVDWFIPNWMAPNIITFLGIVVSCISLFFIYLYNPNLNNDGPRWLHLLIGINVFLYQTFDNMDGKQARKTNTSGPLGMLFDHGCDAINAGLMIISMGSIISSGWTIKLYLCLWSGYLPFYFQVWEEYYIGTMV